MLKNLVALAVFTLGFALFFSFPQVQKAIYYEPCSEPVGYKIGTIDDRFETSQDELKKSLANAEAVWEQDGKNYFEFNPQAELTVNMVYDERQYLSSKLDQLGNKVDDLGDTVGNLEDSLSGKQKSLNDQIADFQQQADAFKVKLDKYESDVNYWNSRGGAPEEEYQKLSQTQQELEHQQQQLSQLEAKIRQETRNYNGDVEKLNQTINNYNKEIGSLKDAASNFNETVKLHPEEGLYDGPKQTIDIYYNISDAGLTHTLAHELGHALGMDHNENKESIMYSYSTESITPTKEDLESLKKVCEVKTAAGFVWERFTEGK